MVASRVLWGSVAGLALAAAIAWVLAQGRLPSAPAAPRAAPQRSELERLSAELAEARERNLRLGAEVEWLRAQIALLGQAQAPAPPAQEPAAPQPEAAAPETGEGSEQDRLWFDAAALAAGGLPGHEVERLREVFDRSEMALIDLEHEARRDAWFRTPRYWQALRDLRMGLREEIGDEDFDLLLYATGRDNRVVISEVLRESPGERAGFQAGDVVVSYGGQRVFRAGELQRATTEGQRGERVAVDVLRDGERVRIYAERGPIGAKLRGARILPEGR
jgi:hypothetical protein